MRVKKEYEFDLYNDTWSGAQEKMKALTDDLRNALENILDSDTEGLFGSEVPDVGEVNDFLWFDDDTYAEWLGFSSADIMWKYCDLINQGVDPDEIWTAYPDDLKTTQDIIDEFKLYQSENPDWEEYYADWEEYAEDNDYASFEI